MPKRRIRPRLRLPLRAPVRCRDKAVLSSGRAREILVAVSVKSRLSGRGLWRQSRRAADPPHLTWYAAWPAARKYRWRTTMPERPLIRAGLRQESPRRVYRNGRDDNHKTITLFVTNADQRVIKWSAAKCDVRLIPAVARRSVAGVLSAGWSGLLGRFVASSLGRFVASSRPCPRPTASAGWDASQARRVSSARRSKHPGIGYPASGPPRLRVSGIRHPGLTTPEPPCCAWLGSTWRRWTMFATGCPGCGTTSPWTATRPRAGSTTRRRSPPRVPATSGRRSASAT